MSAGCLVGPVVVCEALDGCGYRLAQSLGRISGELLLELLICILVMLLLLNGVTITEQRIRVAHAQQLLGVSIG